MRTFVTGASGFVGGAIARQLAGTHEIWAMARSDVAARKVEALGAKPLRCDLESVSAGELRGADVVIHCAARAEEWGSEQDFRRTNVDGTAHLLEVAREAGVRRFVFIGTEAALFHGQDMIDIDETYPYAERSPYPYSRTKGEAERLVLAENTAEFVTLSLRPRLVWGPGDESILPALIGMVRSGKFAWVGGGRYRTSTTHVSNVAAAVERALAQGRGGEAYFVTDDGETTLRDFLTRYLATQGVKAPEKSIPKPLARIAALLCAALWRALGLESQPPLVPFSIDIMSAHCTLRTDKARRELGYVPIVTRDAGLASMPAAHGG
jgi:nucleoside-diphosphate-sugar epimerase